MATLTPQGPTAAAGRRHHNYEVYNARIPRKRHARKHAARKEVETAA